ncbi:unnamed protein product, partial [Amoebophrya sp. A120]
VEVDFTQVYTPTDSTTLSLSRTSIALFVATSTFYRVAVRKNVGDHIFCVFYF